MRLNVTYGFALEGPPDNCAVSNNELSQAAAGKNASFRDVESIHDGNYVVVSRAGALNILQQFAGNQIVHIPAKI